MLDLTKVDVKTLIKLMGGEKECFRRVELHLVQLAGSALTTYRKEGPDGPAHRKAVGEFHRTVEQFRQAGFVIREEIPNAPFWAAYLTGYGLHQYMKVFERLSA